MDDDFVTEVRRWVALRNREPLLRADNYPDGEPTSAGVPDVAWLTPAGTTMSADDWNDADAFMKLIAGPKPDDQATRLALIFNRSDQEFAFALPEHATGWTLLESTAAAKLKDAGLTLTGPALAALKTV